MKINPCQEGNGGKARKKENKFSRKMLPDFVEFGGEVFARFSACVQGQEAEGAGEQCSPLQRLPLQYRFI